MNRPSNPEIAFVVEADPDGGYVASAVGQSIVTQGDTIDLLKQALREAVTSHFDDGKRASLIRLHCVRDEVIAA